MNKQLSVHNSMIIGKWIVLMFELYNLIDNTITTSVGGELVFYKSYLVDIE